MHHIPHLVSTIPFPHENHVTNPTSAIQDPVLNQEPQIPITDSSPNVNQSTLSIATLTPVSPCQPIKSHKTTLENHTPFPTSLTYLTLKLADWNMLLGVLEMFDESMYPISRTKYKLPSETYLRGDFFPVFEELQDQEKSSKGAAYVTSLSDVPLEIIEKLCGLNSLLVVPQFKPNHQNSITVSHSLARMRHAFSTNVLGTTKDKDANFVDMSSQEEYNDPFIVTDELLSTKSMLLLRKSLLEGMASNTAFTYGCLLTLLKESCYRGKCRGRVFCVAK